MSKGHKKHFRAPAAFSTPAKKTGSEPPKSETLKAEPEEPIKLEKVLISDDFYWQVPGDVPASDRRFGMKMVPPGIPNPSPSTETSTASSETTKQTEDIDAKSVTTSTDTIDSTIQAPSNPAEKIESVNTAALISENTANIDSSLQFQSNKREHAEEAITTPIKDSKAKVAASILPRTNIPGAETAKMDTPLNPAPAAETIKTNYTEQQINTHRGPEQDIPSKLKFLEETDKKAWRPNKAWLALPLLLLLGGVLYEALNTEEEITVADNLEQPVVDQPIVDQFQPEQVETVAPAIEEVKTTEAGQVNPVYYITHVVVKGDTLWDISKKYLNDPFRYPEVAELSNIKNPDLIYPGEIITIATTQPVASSVQAQVSAYNVTANAKANQLKPVRFITHVVVKGDTLWHICKKYLHNPFAYPEVAKLSEIKNPDLIYPGDIVRMQL